MIVPNQISNKDSKIWANKYPKCLKKLPNTFDTAIFLGIKVQKFIFSSNDRVNLYPGYSDQGYLTEERLLNIINPINLKCRFMNAWTIRSY